jgi:hypothetical protein
MANRNPSPATRFRAGGKSANPKGRPRAEGEIRALAQQHSAAALERLVQLMHSDNERVAVAAASAVLDRAHGKPPQQMTLDATVRPCDVSSEPLTEQEWFEAYGAPARPNA